MRRIAFISAAALLAFAGIAWAVTNKITYTSVIKKASSAKPSAKSPVPVKYTGTLHVESDPPGQQPDIGAVTTVYFPKNIKQYAKYFPTCSSSAIDGQASFPSKCNAAVVGSGTATAYAGASGNNLGDDVKEPLLVKAVNGSPAGKLIMLVVSAAPGAPVALSNRVVPGTLGPGKGPFGYSVKFAVPKDLQVNTGLAVALTDFSVTINSKTIKKKIGGKVQKVSYLMMTANCPAAGAPNEAKTDFVDTSGNSLGSQTSDTTTKC